jgi:hypothetical protein
MLKSIFSFCRFLIFWIVFAIITRAVFEVYFHEKFTGSTTYQILQTFWYGFRMDASGRVYRPYPLAGFWGKLVHKYHIKPIWLRGYVYFMLFLICFITILNFNIFREWGTKVNFRVFANVYNSPSEAMASTGSSPIGISLSIGAVLLLTVGFCLSHFIIDYNFRKAKGAPPLSGRLSSCCCSGSTLLLCAAVWQLAAISQSTVYFSDNPILNQGALNTEWNLLQNTFESVKTQSNPYLFMPAKRAAALVDSMYAVAKDTTYASSIPPDPTSLSYS